MSGKVFFVALPFLLILSFKNLPADPPSLRNIRAAYDRAEHLFNLPAATSITDSACMLQFRIVIASIASMPRAVATDSLMYEACYKLGVLSEAYKDYAQATHAYLQGIPYSRDAGEKFRMYVFAGAGYYNLNNFDSASFILSRAQELDGDVVSADDRARLFNVLGVLYYDNGNYLQSKNYFAQSLRLNETIDAGNHLIISSVQMNLATCYYKLGLYEKALSIYQNALHYKLLLDPLYMNMGRTYAGLHRYADALTCFKKVKPVSVPGVLNEMAMMAIEEGKVDSATAWLNEYQDNKKSLHTNALDDGVSELYRGNLDIFLAKPDFALTHLQDALIIFSRNFINRDTRKNPDSFNGSFAYYRLFEVLVRKAKAWEMIYKNTSDPMDLKAAYDTYNAIISLLSYIERSYEMDDAKILLKQKSGEVYANALKICLALNKIYPEAGYLKQAFLISEKNKASVMSSGITERSFFESEGLSGALATEERNIRFNIARLNTEADGRVDARALQKMNDEKSVYETRLVDLHKKMETNSRFYQLKYADDFPAVEELQNRMTGSEALISFYNEPEKIEIFALTKSSLDHVELDSGTVIRRDIQSWIEILQSSENSNHEKMRELNARLYEELVKPLLSLAADKKEWTIIPDGLFFLLPVESLPVNMNGNRIIENHIVNYEFSARFIGENKPEQADRETGKPALSFAPFSQRGADMQSEGMGWLEKLSFSADEISGLRGISYTDQQATKEMFLKNLNKYPIIHLATHAVTDLDNPSASYIAFFPATGSRAEDFLFLDEIYSLRMDSCQMIVVSACETGRGELVHNEGVMSFARAFLYSGCPSTINTLWKADDHSTDEILKSFYQYLEAGYSKSEALQKAKLDFIRKNPIMRNPAYWSHIILTGNPDALYKKKQPWFRAVFVICCGTILFFFLMKRKRKKADAFQS